MDFAQQNTLLKSEIVGPQTASPSFIALTTARLKPLAIIVL